MSSNQKGGEWQAHAKVNLALHVVGQRADGFHLLDSIVCFCEIGDALKLDSLDANRTGLKLSIGGEFSGELTEADNNLISKAYAAAQKQSGEKLPALEITLTKNLPVASGIGGGSADAAAMLNLLEFHALLDPLRTDSIALALGADVPMCLDNVPKRVGGIGEQVVPIPTIPKLHLLLANAQKQVSTPDVFSRLEKKENAPIAQANLGHFSSAQELCDFLTTTRNDLQPPAQCTSPEISTVLGALGKAPDCMLARMSGSGGTCFAIFPDQISTRKAEAMIQSDYPDWWVKQTSTFGTR